jgi:DNA-binding protein H-NS
MATLSSIRKQIAALEKKAQDLLKRESASAIAKAKEIIAAYGLTAQDLGLSGAATKGSSKATAGRKPRKAKGQKTSGVPMYRDPETQKTWTGRGKPPTWIAGVADRTPFLITTQDAPQEPQAKPARAAQGPRKGKTAGTSAKSARKATRKAAPKKRPSKQAAAAKNNGTRQVARKAMAKKAARERTSEATSQPAPAADASST